MYSKYINSKKKYSANNDKTVLITGASSGIGRQLACIFARRGFRLVITARRISRLNKLGDFLTKTYGTSVTVIPMDLSETNAADCLYDRVKEQNISVDILVNNVGLGYHNAFLFSDFLRQQNMINLNINLLVRLTYLFGGDMKNRGSGKILNVASATAFLPGPYMSVYYASKAFVLSFSLAVSSELKGSGVTVTTLCPAAVNTGFERAAQMSADSKLFKVMPLKAFKTARVGYKAVMDGKAQKNYGIIAHGTNLISRILPRRAAGFFAQNLNGKKV